MNIVSYHESFNDFTDRLCVICFTQTCSLNCINCQNKERLLRESTVNINDFYKYLNNAKPLVKSVTISGGEPTDEIDLVDFVIDLKMRGYDIRLDTNGTRSSVLYKVLPYLSEVAMDIKEDPNDFDKYKRICRTITKNQFDNVKYSLQLLSDWMYDDFKVILRTTLFDDKIDVEAIEKSLAPYKYTKYIVQPLVKIIT